MCTCGYVVCRAGVTDIPSKGKGKRPYAPKCNGFTMHVWERARGYVADQESEDEE